MKIKSKKRGRPSIVNWSKYNLQWKNKTDTEIAATAGCTIPNVNIRRKKLIAACIAKGESPDFYICKRKYARAKKVVVAQNA